MHESLFPILSALKDQPMMFDELCRSAQLRDPTDAVNRLFSLVRLGLVLDDNGVYSLTSEGARNLDAQDAPVEDTPKPRTMELGRRPDEPSQTSSSAPVPLFHVKMDRWGNPWTVPFTLEERRKEEMRQRNLKAMEAESAKRAKAVVALPPEWFTDGKPTY